MTRKPLASRDAYQGTFRHKNGGGHFEVFWYHDYDIDEPGWYWWTCEPGCIPDSDAFGPFRTSHIAWRNAKYGP